MLRGDGPAAGVPKILHQIWVGSPPPDWVLDNWTPWTHILPSDWEICLWTDGTSDEWPLSARVIDDVPHPAILSDYIRLEVLHQYGGIYLDSDTRPLRSLDPLTGPARTPWISSTSESWLPVAKRHLTVNNSAIGVPPRSAVVAEVWAEAIEAIHLRPRRLSQWAGPGPWGRARDKHPLELLPENCFPGVPHRKRHQVLDMSTEYLAEAYTDAYAIHEYDQSWNPGTTPVHA